MVGIRETTQLRRIRPLSPLQVFKAEGPATLRKSDLVIIKRFNHDKIFASFLLINETGQSHSSSSTVSER